VGRNFRTVVHILVLLLILFNTACHPNKGTDSSTNNENGSTTKVSEAGVAKKSGASKKKVSTTEVITASGIHMVVIPDGQFMMGSEDGNPDEYPSHKVTVHSFMIDKYPVTGDMFAKVKMPNPSHWQGTPNLPVEQISWQNARRYCNERSRLEGLKPCYDLKSADCNYEADGYRLPTEAEWEYAARAGADGPYDFESREQLRDYSWYGANSNGQTHTVGTKSPNHWGLYDMYGNVSTWCQDAYDPTYYATSPTADPHGPTKTVKDGLRTLRGGNWKSSPNMCRATYRQGESSAEGDGGFVTDYVGVRCVRNVRPEELAKLTVVTPKTAP